MSSRIIRIAAALSLAVASASALAQAWPSRTITVINGFTPGSIIDVTARLYSAELQKRLGVAVVSEARPGAGSLIAAQAVAKAAPDGYTFNFGSQLITSAVFVKNNPIVVPRDLVPVADLHGTPLYVYVRTGLPLNSYDDLLAHAKANPNKLNFGIAGGAITELMVAALNISRPGLTYTGIPFKGTPEIATAMMNGEIDFTISSIGPFPPAIQSGKVKPLMTLWATRTTNPPFFNVPTAAESGMANIRLTSGTGFWAPAGTAADIIQKVGDAAMAGLKSPEVNNALANIGAVPAPITAAGQLQNYFETVKFYTDAAKITGFQPQ
jgi:tripartite-type tricarboxylate transporter receptor subunit TctC